MRHFIENYKLLLINELVNLDGQKIEHAAAWVEMCKQNGGTVWLCGNGGLASTAGHMAGDLSNCVKVKALNLADNQASVLAFANDLEFKKVFSEQLKLHGEPGDLLVVMSGSGMSENLIEVVRVAKEKGITTLALTGRDGGELGPLADLEIRVPLENMGQIQDLHSVILHIISYGLME